LTRPQWWIAMESHIPSGRRPHDRTT
jgi:hypothetical protein